MSDSTALTQYRSTYVAKKALFSFLGAAFRLYGSDGTLAFFVKQKAFKLREEITVYADEQMKKSMLGIKARQIRDVSATYDVTDSNTGETVGGLKRKGLRSIFRDEWAILDTNDTEVGTVKEDSGLMALLRRFVKLIPQTFVVTVNGKQAGVIKQQFNPFILAYNVDFSQSEGLDPRMGVAMTVLLLAIEGRQQ